MNHSTIFLCPPTAFTLKYEINAWMDTDNQIQTARAQEQWDALCTQLKNTNADVAIIHGDLYPDSVFIANAGLIINNTFILSRFRYAERQNEEKVWQEQFSQCGYNVIQPPEQHYFEGAGDALFWRDTLIGGSGFRSTTNTYDWIEQTLDIDTLPVQLVDSHFYHLDTCFCPLNNDVALIYKNAFSKESLQQLESFGGTLISVDKDDAHRFACNAICINNSVILPQGNTKTEEQLKKYGYTPLPTDMTEYIKSGGAVKCCTLTPYTTNYL